MFTELYHRIAPACCYITVVVDDEVVSEGTGFAFNGTGDVMTAAHVVTGRWPVKPEDYQNPRQKIYCKFPNLPVAEYGVAFCGIDIEVSAFVGRVQLDVAGLVPKQAFAGTVSHIPALTQPPQLGERVFIAGYSEELELPFRVDKLLAKDFPGAEAFREAMAKGYMADMTGPLFKQGVVGNIRRVVAENSQNGDRVECDVFYIDNSMHSGASGGPVFNESGDAVGVVSERAVTSVNVDLEVKAQAAMLQVPSGCTVAISLAPLLHITRKTGGIAA